VNLEKLFEQILLLSIMGSIIAIATLVLKGIFKNKLSARFHYYIWFLLLFKLLVPMNYQSQLNPINYFNIQSQGYNISSITNDTISKNLNFNLDPSIVNQSSRGISTKNATVSESSLGFNMKTAALIWIIGIGLFLLYVVIVNVIILINIKRSNHCKRGDIRKILKESKEKLNVKSNITIIYDKYLKSPYVYGIISPKIVISEDILNKLEKEELKYVFLHEVTHIKRKDLIVNVFIIMLQAIYWFNPVIWYSLYRFKQDCEVACDATALKTLNAYEAREYGQTIINMIKINTRSKILLGTLGFANKYSKRRIIMITLFNKRSTLRTAIGIITAFTLIFMVGCSSLNKPSKDNSQNSNVTQDDNKQNEVNNDNSSQNSNVTNNSNNNSNATIQNNNQDQLLQSINNLAKQGKIINSDFQAKTTNLQDIEKAWGKADKSEWVGAAKGMYTTYTKRNVVFGSNKGDQVFEVRSYDKKLNEVTLQMVKKYFGNPAYNVKSNGEQILGYVASKDFKILFVFSGTSGSNDTKLDHYSVLYPKGTVNNMADDPGREW
jgi:Antirepressor regulating drug resistance, predicted signal transduction N-terminal membrane component